MPQPLAPMTPQRRKPHWIAGTFYLVLAVGGLIATAHGQLVGLLATILCGLYAVYLYRGGRVVIWFW
jgi:hypothetical protein